jgi:hypothetical protein
MFKFFGSVAGHIKVYFLVNVEFIGHHWIIVGLFAAAVITAGVIVTRKIEG